MEDYPLVHFSEVDIIRKLMPWPKNIATERFGVLYSYLGPQNPQKVVSLNYFKMAASDHFGIL